MKLRLPVLLRAALLAVVAFSPVYAETLEVRDVNKPGDTASYFYSDKGGFALTSYESILFDNNAALFGVVRVENFLYGTTMGISLKGNGDITFSSNQSLATANRWGLFGGGALSANADFIELTGNRDLYFTGNKALGSTATTGGDGGAILLESISYGGRLDIKDNRDVVFSGNEAAGQGGAIHVSSSGTAVFANVSGNRNVLFENNKALTKGINAGNGGNGGAIYVKSGYAVIEGNDSVIFRGNQAANAGAGIYSLAGLSITGNGSVEFSGNKSATAGSALSSGMWMEIQGNGNVTFKDNETSGEGSALYFAMLETVSGQPALNLLSADGGDILFDGNLQNKGLANESRLGMVGVVARFADLPSRDQASDSNKVNDVTMRMRAADGKSVTFYDALYLAKYSQSDADKGTSSLSVELNKGAGYTGNIVLSGEKNGGKVLESLVSGDVSLYQGTLVVKDKAHLALVDTYTGTYGYGGYTKTDSRRDFYSYDSSVLEMTGAGAMTAGKFDVTTHTVLRTGSGATLDANKVNMSQGVTFDINPFLDSADSGLSITANSWLLNGNIRLSDTLDYNDSRWSQDQRFLLIVDAAGSRGQANFSGIVSNATDSSYIGEGYSNKGSWSYEWVDGSLYAVWEREVNARGELWWDGEGAGAGNGVGTWNQMADNKVWNLDRVDGVDFDFQDMDIVHFARSGVVNIEGNIEVRGNVKPGGVIDVSFNSGKGELIWQGTGSIVGRASMEKYGSGVLVILTENSFSGGTDMYGGVIRVESKTGLGAGGVTLHGGLVDLCDKGVTNDIRVVGKAENKAALAGIALGNVVVEKRADGDPEAALYFLAGTSFASGVGHIPAIDDAVLVNGASSVSIQSGASVNSYINLTGADSSLNLIAGNGGTSLITGGALGAGSLNVVSGKHRILETVATDGTKVFNGQVNIMGGELTASAARTYANVLMTGGVFVADSRVVFEKLTVGSDDSTRTEHQIAMVKVNPVTSQHNPAYMEASDVLINGNATFVVDGIFNAKGETHVKAGGSIAVQSNSRAISWGMVYDELSADGLSSSRIDLTDNTSEWNANGGFKVHYIDASTGQLTIGSNSVIEKDGYFYAENIVRGTDKNGNYLDLNTPLDELPILTIKQGATLWAGNTVKYGDGTYETQTGFYCVTLDIDALASIGTFVVRDYASDGIVTHDNIVHSMKRAFEPKLVDGKDMRTYLYVLKQDVTFSSEHVLSNETVHVDTGAGAVVENTSGTLVNLNGELTVNGIDETTGTVTAAGGNTNLIGATSDLNKVHFIGSVNSSLQSKKETSAEIKLVENNSSTYTVKVDTVQAQTGETTKIGANSLVDARNFIISGEKTTLDNEKGTLEVKEEVTLSQEAAYKVGTLDRFGWVNMNKGDLNLTRSAWKNITLGSYSGATSETDAKVRLNENQANNVDAKELAVVGGNEHTYVKENTKVSTDLLTAGKGSLLEVDGGDVQVRKNLVFEEGVTQIGRIQLVQSQEAAAPKGRSVTGILYGNMSAGMADAVQVMLAGNNFVGHMDSSAGTAQFHNSGFNHMDNYTSAGKDGWVFVLTDDMLDQQDPLNAITKIANQTGNALSNIILDTSKLTKSYFGDIQLYSDNITLTSEEVDYGEASGVYNQKDAIKNFSYINPVIPELGQLTINSLWTMVSAMDAFSSAVMGQMDFSPYRQYLARNIWAKGLYMNENIGNALPGYRKDSGGYAIGADTLLNAKNLIGVSFAQMLGTEMTNRHMAEDDQNIMMAALYGRHIFEACDKGSTVLDFMVGYGRGDNDGTFYKNGASSFSNWKSDVFNAELKATCYRKLTDRVWVNPYVGAEFVFAEHKSHFVHGAAGDFDVSRSRMHALRMPIGATLEYKTTSSVTNYIGASYVPDVLRRNPSATVTNGMYSERIGDVSVGRNAARVYTGCTWQIDKQWLINLNYEVETASQKVNQVGRVTTSYSF